MRALDQLREAIENQGPAPRFHRGVMAKHRTEWPTLWAAIDALLADKDSAIAEPADADRCCTCGCILCSNGGGRPNTVAERAGYTIERFGSRYGR